VGQNPGLLRHVRHAQTPLGELSSKLPTKRTKRSLQTCHSYKFHDVPVTPHDPGTESYQKHNVDRLWTPNAIDNSIIDAEKGEKVCRKKSLRTMLSCASSIFLLDNDWLVHKDTRFASYS
jgi:hypothetical protein